MRIALETCARSLMAGCVLLAACGSPGRITGSGTIDERVVPVDGFDRLQTCCGFQVEVASGSSSDLRITGDDNIIAAIQVTSSNGLLELYIDRDYDPTQPVEITVATEGLRAVSASGGSRVAVDGQTSQALDITVSGGTRLFLTDATFDSVDAGASGGSSISLSDSSVGTQTVDMSGGSVLDAATVESERVDLSMSGGSRATVWVSEALAVDASGGSTVEYYGDPGDVDQSLSGDSTVTRLGSAPP